MDEVSGGSNSQESGHEKFATVQMVWVSGSMIFIVGATLGGNMETNRTCVRPIVSRIVSVSRIVTVVVSIFVSVIVLVQELKETASTKAIAKKE